MDVAQEFDFNPHFLKENHLLLHKKKKIMIIDDDLEFRLYMAELLVNDGYIVTTAKDGQAGIDQLLAEDDLPDLILLDLKMPKKDGLEFRKEQEKIEHISHIPVVLMSGDLAPHEKLKEVNAIAFMTKPMNFLEVLEIVHEVAS